MPGAVLSGSIRDEVKSGFPAGVESPKEAGATGREFRLRRSDTGLEKTKGYALGNLQPLAGSGEPGGGRTLGRPGGGMLEQQERMQRKLDKVCNRIEARRG
jgi:hypothetical protein